VSLAKSAVLCLSAALSLPAVAATLDDGVYTEDQAETGEDLFEAHCGTCHETDYFEDVLRAWNGVAFTELFDVTAGTMPQSNPGSLLDDQYLAIFAYILAENDYPEGEATLKRWGAPEEIVVVAP
jgi:mono/diheme cytochrome c family protein